jgi:uncharacterized alkaline shock family protein YloU
LRSASSVRRLGCKGWGQTARSSENSDTPLSHLDLVTQYGESIPAIAQAVRHTVAKRIQDLTGLEVTEVNITVGDITPEPQPR